MLVQGDSRKVQGSSHLNCLFLLFSCRNKEERDQEEKTNHIPLKLRNTKITVVEHHTTLPDLSLNKKRYRMEAALTKIDLQKSL